MAKLQNSGPKIFPYIQYRSGLYCATRSWKCRAV